MPQRQRQAPQQPPAHGDFEYGDNGKKKEEEEDERGAASSALEPQFLLKTPSVENRLEKKAFNKQVSGGAELDF